MIDYYWIQICRMVLIGAILFVPHAVFAQEPDTQEQQEFTDPYVVENIEVDVTADNAVEAREKAFEEAQIKGYEELARRFLSEEELENHEVPDIAVIAPLVRDFEVTNEKLSMVRYKGIYKIRYSKNAFDKPDPGNVFGGAAMNRTGELLVLPFYDMNGQTFLWQINPFFDAWRRAEKNNALGKIIVPQGSPDDIRQIKDGQALTYNYNSLRHMQSRYGARQTVIMTAMPESDFQSKAENIVVNIYRPQSYGPELSRQLVVRGYPGEAEGQLFNRVVATVAQTLHNDWERQTAVPVQPALPAGSVKKAPVMQVPVLTGAPNSLSAQLNFSSARQWVETKKAIQAIQGVNTVTVKGLSARSATLTINFLGSVDRLKNALFQQGITMKKSRQPPQNDVDLYILNSVRGG